MADPKRNKLQRRSRRAAALTKMDFLKNRPHAPTLAEEHCIKRLLVAYSRVMPHMRVRLAKHLARYVVERGGHAQTLRSQSNKTEEGSD
ncbi:hypothetical protein FALBO_5681 [Fusarium albosuccineum]|uniref:Uncharacterized protein n=1 Tax=Fusarium albosuccineum TaxID=1237068 RepID=A0A8H4LH88_9HYPO|nr:hypothetical protein FALBO_5681 [Fusarium albosuccineum]